MIRAIINTIERFFGINNPFKTKNLIFMCFILSVFILARSLADVFFYAFAGVSLIIVMLSNIQYCVPILFYLLPFSSILKPNLDAMSLFTILFFLVIVKMVISTRTIQVSVLIWLGIVFVYNLIFSGFEQITTILTTVGGLMLVYYSGRAKLNTNISILSFSLGLCFSSALAMMKASLPIINSFIRDNITKLGDDSYASRFSGLQGNPNYFTLDIIIALAAIIVFIYNNNSKPIHNICIVALSVFGLMSVSKSFLLAWLLLVAFWFIISLRQGIGNVAKFFFVAIMGAAVIYLFAYDYINSYFARLAQDSNATSIDDVTTGRTEIWRAYIKVIFGNLDILVFGKGLKAILKSAGKGTHNTYLETLFQSGIVGTTVTIASIKACMGKVSLKGAIWLPVLMLLIRMLGIGILTYDNLWFYFVIIVILSRDYTAHHEKRLYSGREVL